jgi:hypothetical protein
MTQWKDKTRGGHQYRITTRDPDSDFPIRGEIEDSGLRFGVAWDQNGKYPADDEHPYDLIPIEPEAPCTVKARVDLALAAHCLLTAVVEFRRAEDAKDKLGKAMFEAFAAAGMLDVVVKIDGDYYHFFASELTTRFRKTEVL